MVPRFVFLSLSFFRSTNPDLNPSRADMYVPDNNSVPSKSQTTLMALIEAAGSGPFSSQGAGGDSGGGDNGGAGGAGGSSAGVRMMLTTRDASKLTAHLRKCVKPYKVTPPFLCMFARRLQSESDHSIAV